MNSLTADSSLQQSLSALPGLTEVRDSNGIVLGYFSPARRQLPEVYAQAAAALDPAEMIRRKESAEKASTTSEVLRRLATPES